MRGNDFALAAHQALTARGHALRALQSGTAASAFYADHADGQIDVDLGRKSDGPSSKALAFPTSLGFTAYHDAAANHHDAAVRHHGQAAKHFGADHYVRAGTETKNALDHTQHALFQGDQAALHHMEHYGSHPSAELA